MTEETIKALAEDHVKTFWYEQAENIQRKIEMAFKAGYKAALSGTERVECYLPDEPQHCLGVFEYTTEGRVFVEYVKKVTLTVVLNHQ